jgi:hypothetical protein
MVLEDNSFWRVNSKKKISDKTSEQRVASARLRPIDFSDNLRRTMPIVPWSILQATRLEEAAEKRGSFVAMEQ